MSRQGGILASNSTNSSIGKGGGKGAMNQPMQQNQHSTVFITANSGQPIVGQTPRPQYRDKSERIAVPAMPMPAAVVCCILNFLIPGFGTFCAGFSAFCCSRNEDLDGAARFVSCLINCGIAFAQLATFLLCLIGWFWSCAWGVFFIGMSAEYYHNRRIAADGGYINQQQPMAQQGVVIVTNQPTQQTTSFMQQPMQPPAYSSYPPPGQEKPTGAPPQYQPPPPPAYPY